MIDPMANLDGGASASIDPNDQSSSSPGATGTDGKDVFNMPALQLNMQKTDDVRSFMGIISGCVAGILGLTGLRGISKLARLGSTE